MISGLLKTEVHPAVTVLALGLLGWAGLRHFERHCIYFPDRAVEAAPLSRGLAFEELSLETSDGKKISAWFIPAASSSPVVVFCHGNAGNMSHRLDKIKIFNSLGLGVLIFDYRGYGESRGTPSEKGTYADAEASYEYLAARGITPGRMLFYGESLGCAVALELAARHGPAAVILESPFTSIGDLGELFYPRLPVRLMVSFKYDNSAKISRISCPLLVLHSRDDEIVPFGMGRKLFDAARPPKDFFVMKGSHNDGFLVTGKEYVREIESFAGKHLAGPENPGKKGGRL